jgi:hypothetical protein
MDGGGSMAGGGSMDEGGSIDGDGGTEVADRSVGRYEILCIDAGVGKTGRTFDPVADAGFAYTMSEDGFAVPSDTCNMEPPQPPRSTSKPNTNIIRCSTLLANASIQYMPRQGGEGECLDVLAPSPGERGSCLARLPEHKSSPAGCPEPEQHVGKQHPYCVLHACDARVALRVLGDVHPAEDTKRNEVAQPDECVDVEKEPRLDHWHHEDECCEGTQATANDSPDPFRVDVFVLLARVVEVLRVQADDNDAEYELEEADDELYCAADGKF